MWIAHCFLRFQWHGASWNVATVHRIYRNDFLLFPKLKTPMKGKRFVMIEEVKEKLKQALLHTYIIGHYNLSVRIFDLVAHTTYVVCVNFIHKWCAKLGWVVMTNYVCMYQFLFGPVCGTYSLKSILNDRFFEKLFMAVSIFSQSFCQISAEEILEGILFVFCFNVWPGTWTLTLCPISLHTTY